MSTAVASLGPAAPTASTAAAKARDNDSDDFHHWLKQTAERAHAADKADARRAGERRVEDAAKKLEEAPHGQPIDPQPPSDALPPTPVQPTASTDPDDTGGTVLVEAKPATHVFQLPSAATSGQDGDGLSTLAPTARERAAAQTAAAPAATAGTGSAPINPAALLPQAASTGALAPSLVAGGRVVALGKTAPELKAAAISAPASGSGAPSNGDSVARVQPNGALTADAVTAVSGDGPEGAATDPGDDSAPVQSSADAPASPAGSHPLPADPAASPVAAAAADPVRGSPATVQSLAAEMVQRLGQQVTRFEVALNPAGLGRVDVTLEIGAKGGVSARLACDHAGTADELKARQGELAGLLGDAGFDVGAGDLSFAFDPGLAGGDLSATLSGGSGFSPSEQDARSPASSALRSFGAAADALDLSPPSPGRALRGLDIVV